MKNTEWLKKEVNDYLDIEGVEDARMALKAVLDYIDQLDEPEFTESHLISFICEKYGIKNRFFAKRALGIVFDNIDSKTSIGELLDKFERSETLSKKWIENHTASAYTIAHYSEEDVRVIMVSDLEKLLVPKQELPEPEVLSDKWIDEHAFGDWDGYVYNEYVSVENLQNLLVPKQELPVIPKFVADWIEASRHAMYHLLGAVYDGAYSEDMKEWLFKGDKRTRQDNQDKLTRAWLDGYTVEEKKYQIHFGNHKYAQRFNDKWLSSQITDKEFASTFTKEEIKKLENSDLYWDNFAEEVTE